MTCEHCGEPVPDAAYCTRCGAHRGTTGQSGDPRRRSRAYAAQPGEHVGQLAAFSTLLPHLGHDRVHELRYAFFGAMTLLILLVATGLVVAALLGAIFLVPILYLVYLYEAQVYGDEPQNVLGLTVGGGLVIGVVLSVIADKVLQGSGKGESVGQVVVFTVILPIVQIVLMTIAPLLLRGRPQFVQTIDGLVFGVASGLGFSVGEGLVRFSSVFTNEGLHTESANWLLPLISVAVLVPLLHGSSAGVAVASLWRSDRRGHVR
ncbi:MAG TPA: PrsW family glutamic-type intramembrane protease, partial [Pseudonocardiaceae bacterium]|nr:PrsW family glutamic-type intramembrane protease [Pseudonocardiaceae bacterium]